MSVPHLPPALHLICRRKWGDPEGKRGARTREGKERDEEEQQEGRRQKKRRERNSLQAQRPGAQTLTSHSSDPEVQPGEARVACYPWWELPQPCTAAPHPALRPILVGHHACAGLQASSKELAAPRNLDGSLFVPLSICQQPIFPEYPPGALNHPREFYLPAPSSRLWGTPLPCHVPISHMSVFPKFQN